MTALFEPEVFGQVTRSLDTAAPRRPAMSGAVAVASGGIRIGGFELANRVALAPMAGVTDLPFRRLCHRLGAGLVVSEMVASDPELRDTLKSRQRRVHDLEIEPRSVQIAGGDPEVMAAAARFNVAEGAQIIDINMGCPAKKVCRKAAGSALLQDPQLVRDILTATVAAVDVPVTLKIRTGPSREHRNGVDIARIAEDAGIAALAVHGRTRADRFRGDAEFETIASIVAAVDIPVYANGDIDSPARAARVLDATGAAGVMIGRAAQGRPWLCGQIAIFLAHGEAPPEPDLRTRCGLLLEHLAELHGFHGAYRGLRIARKHVDWAISALNLDRERARTFLRGFNTLDEADAQLGAIHAFFEALELDADEAVLAARAA